MPLGSKIVAGGIAGLLELGIFHPIDTVTKRLMTSRRATRLSPEALSGVVFATSAQAPPATLATTLYARGVSLYQGLGHASIYKVLQRSYKYGFQPYVANKIRPHIGDKVLASAVAGAMVGAGEVALLPFDVLKIRAQTNPESLSGRSVLQLFRTEGRGLYRGAGWTVARNVPGSFALFGGNSLAKQAMGLDPRMDGQADLWQNLVASGAGAVLSLGVSSPLDVIKTRVQQGMTGDSGTQVLSKLLRTEGGRALFKGLGTKLTVVAPKMIFSMTVAQHVMQWFN